MGGTGIRRQCLSPIFANLLILQTSRFGTPGALSCEQLEVDMKHTRIERVLSRQKARLAKDSVLALGILSLFISAIVLAT